MHSHGTHRQRCVFIQLVFGSDAEASVVATGSPGQSDRRLQLVVHLLVDGSSELGPIVTDREKSQIQTRSDLFQPADATVPTFKKLFQNVLF